MSFLSNETEQLKARIASLETQAREQQMDLEALKASEERLKLSITAADIGTWDWHVPSGTVTFNEGWAQMIGYELAEIQPHVSSWEKLLHDDDLPQVMQQVDDCLTGKTDTFETEYRMRCKCGDWCWILDKGRVAERDEEGRAIRFCGIQLDITDRKKADQRVKHLHDLMTYIIAHSRSAIAVHDRDLNYIWVSQRYLDEYDIKESDVIGRHHYQVFPDLPQKWRDVHQRALRGEVCTGDDDPYIHEDGSVDWTRWECRPWFEADGSIGGIIVYTEVITARKRAEEEREKLRLQLMQAQKMESIGRLAGGVAHDFNNMLNVILGHAELAQLPQKSQEALLSHLKEIEKAARRSADLTRQLLAFARKQTISPQVLDLNETVSGMLKMLQRLVGEDIELNWVPGNDLWPVKMDPSQIDQVLANLLVNARDAIAGIGKVTVETHNTSFDSEYCAANSGFIPGEYVALMVSDNGCGMKEETLAHLFEPFFTTKGIGKGTGLGLATIYGIVKQNEGFINVYSEVGIGTTLKIYIPRQDGIPETLHTVMPAEEIPHGSETILLVEDDPLVLETGRHLLQALGYRILAAGSASEAVKMAMTHAKEIQLLLTDVVMPDMNGNELAKLLTEQIPNLKVIFTSGYTANVIAHHGVLNPGVHFIPKPYRTESIAAKLRQVLDAKQLQNHSVALGEGVAEVSKGTESSVKSGKAS